MYSLTVTNRKQLERATLRAQSQKLKMEEVSFGIYKVWGSTGKLYVAGIEPSATGNGYDVCCSCPTQAPDFCKHVSTVMPHYQMREKEMGEPDPTLCGCGQPGFSFIGGCWVCYPCIEQMAETEAEKDVVRDLKQEEREELAAAPRKCINRNCTVSADAGCSGYCADCYNGLMQDRKDHEDIFGFAPARRERIKEEW